MYDADDRADFVYRLSDAAYSYSWLDYTGNIGDVSGDGADDLLISIRTSSYYTYSYAYYGGDTGDVFHDADDDFGVTCLLGARGGDFDGSASTYEWACGNLLYSSSKGAAYIMRGSSVVATLPGEATGDAAGEHLARDVDVNGDGINDLLVAAAYNAEVASASGAVYVVHGPLSGTVNLSGADARVLGSGRTAYLGSDVVAAGVTTGDGRDDFLVSAPGANYTTTGGTVYLFSGNIRGDQDAESRATVVIRGEGDGDAIGGGGDALSVGDVNGDSVADVLIGAPYNSNVATQAGAAWLLYGPLSGTIALGTDTDAVWRGLNAGDWLGQSVAIVPDTTGDGADDLAFSAVYGDADGAPDWGVAWIWPGD